MLEATPFLAQVLADPGDVDRLHVYADWLADHGDPRATYVRLQVEHRRASDPSRLPELRENYPAHHPEWTGTLELAGAFEANLVDYASMWWGVGLTERASNATFHGFDLAVQPPIPLHRFDGSLTWLGESDPGDYAGLTHTLEPGGWVHRIRQLRAEGFVVPEVFERFITQPDLHTRIPSCTDNYVVSADAAEAHAQPDGSTFLTFYADSQSCVFWGLRLGRGADRYAPVLAGAPDFPDQAPERGRRMAFPELTFSSSTLEGFLYRWWIENHIWFATEYAPRDLSEAEAQYLAHLAANGDS